MGYPSRFELRDAADLIDGTSKLQLVLAACGNAPNTERELIQATIRQLLLGLDDDEYRALDDEIELLVKTKSQLKEQIRDLPDADDRVASRGDRGPGSDETARRRRARLGRVAVTMRVRVIPAMIVIGSQYASRLRELSTASLDCVRPTVLYCLLSSMTLLNLLYLLIAIGRR